jgi:Family of unknown function (DUF5957)
MMRTVVLAILGLIVGFFVGEALAVLIGVTTNLLSDSAPPGSVLWIFRPLPFVFAIAGATALPALDSRSRPR